MKEEKGREREDLKERHVTKSPLITLHASLKKLKKADDQNHKLATVIRKEKNAVAMDNVLSALQSFV